MNKSDKDGDDNVYCRRGKGSEENGPVIVILNNNGLASVDPPPSNPNSTGSNVQNEDFDQFFEHFKQKYCGLFMEMSAEGRALQDDGYVNNKNQIILRLIIQLERDSNNLRRTMVDNSSNDDDDDLFWNSLSQLEDNFEKVYKLLDQLLDGKYNGERTSSGTSQ